MKGSLYIITNDINSKVYIGKTYSTIQDRWNRHLYDAFRNDKENNNKLYNAIRKYGPNHFQIRLIDQFNEGELEQKEQEYIAKYDSYHNGYNSTLGGDGYLVRDINEETVINLYNNGLSISAITLELNLGSSRRISKIIKDSGLSVNRETKVQVEQYTLDNILINIFESKMDAWKWLVENYKTDIKRNTAYYYIKKASETNGIAFGYKWKQYNTDVIAENIDNKNNTWYCNAYNDNGIVFENQRVVDVARTLINNKITSNDNLKTVSRTIIDHNKNCIYDLYWEVYKQ